MNTNNNTFDILKGPNKDILFDACKYAYNKLADITVKFTVAAGYTAPPEDPRRAYIPMSVTDIVICGIEHEDGSGESFNLHGYCNANLDPSSRSGNMIYKPYRFVAYYNVKRRKGHITFSK